jgi:type IV secretory pathway VirB2 component (pilin)
MKGMNMTSYFRAFAILAVAAIATFFAADAFAQTIDLGALLGGGTNPLQRTQTKIQSNMSTVMTIVGLIGVMGVIGLVVMAYFGRFQWKWAFSLGAGLMILGLASAWVSFLMQA